MHERQTTRSPDEVISLHELVRVATDAQCPVVAREAQRVAAHEGVALDGELRFHQLLARNSTEALGRPAVIDALTRAAVRECHAALQLVERQYEAGDHERAMMLVEPLQRILDLMAHTRSGAALHTVQEAADLLEGQIASLGYPPNPDVLSAAQNVAARKRFQLDVARLAPHTLEQALDCVAECERFERICLEGHLQRARAFDKAGRQQAAELAHRNAGAALRQLGELEVARASLAAELRTTICFSIKGTTPYLDHLLGCARLLSVHDSDERAMARFVEAADELVQPVFGGSRRQSWRWRGLAVAVDGLAVDVAGTPQPDREHAIADLWNAVRSHLTPAQVLERGIVLDSQTRADVILRDDSLARYLPDRDTLRAALEACIAHHHSKWFRAPDRSAEERRHWRAKGILEDRLASLLTYGAHQRSR